MAKEKAKKDKKMNLFFRLLFAVILPLLVVVMLALFVLSFIGIDVLGWTEEKLTTAPIISSFVKTEDEKALTDKLDKANETIQSQTEQITRLESEIDQFEAQIEQLELDRLRIENERESAANLVDEDLEEDVDIKKLASSFKNMDKEQAAQIVANLNVANAVLLLTNVSSDVRGEILEEMEPNVAANLVEQMME